MLLWAAEDIALIDASLRRARDGQPIGLMVEGAAGMGKSSWLDEVQRRATGFHSVLAEGVEGHAAPFGVLRQWGVTVALPTDGGLVDPFVAAQGVRRLLDDLGGPVLLACDDLQWCDAESIDALTWLLRRAAGDQLVVATASRPVGELHPGWQRLLAAMPGGRRNLRGLSLADAVSLARQQRAGATSAQVEALWRHTSGNPLYLRELLDRFDLDELTEHRVLPAPAEFTRSVTARLDELSLPSRRLLEAGAVMSTGWCSLADVSDVGEVDEPAAHLDELLAEGLVSLRGSGVSAIRLRHSLVRSAVYQAVPLHRRQALHRRVADLTLDPGTALEHRVAAAEGTDDALAAELANYARRQHARRAHRQAARFLRWSSEVASDRQQRQDRWLDALFDSVLAGDFDLVHASAPTLVDLGETTERAVLALGALAVIERREQEGIALLQPLVQLPATDPQTRYRAEVLLAWAQIAAGEAPEVIQQGIERYLDLPDVDPALAGFVVLTVGGNAVRVRGLQSVLTELDALPTSSRLVPAEQTFELAWRGSLRCRLGMFGESVDDLTEVVRRIQEGTADFSGGVFHAFLARAQWMNGDWPHSQLNFRLAEEIAAEAVHPLTMAMAPIMVAATGQREQATSRLAQAELVLQARPWQDQAELLLVTAVVVAHASPDVADRRGLLDRLRQRAYQPDRVTRRTVPWLLHAALAGMWAADDEYVIGCLEQLVQVPAAPLWRNCAVSWLQGLLSVQGGHLSAASESLDRAIADATSLMPLYLAHLWRDRALLARRSGDDDRSWRELADAQYRRLGATSYLVADHEADSDPARPVPVFGLSERERDVLTVVLTGMSYAQIAQELFITSKTVGYHLGNIYAKCGVTSRHQLAEQARRHPQQFGLR